ncbi:MAG: ABC transporter ATP-binding protein [Prevotellaceae bacterium]|nr:ABC transporter ATP-binding protein [Prevotellaceae bacterium]
MNVVSARGLSKSYRKVQALQRLSFEVEQGEIYGIIGADGAGKSTLLRILATLMTADEGSARVEGLDVVRDYRALRNIVGYMPGRFSLYQDLTVEENLNFFATLFGTTVSANYTLIEEIYSRLVPFKHRRAGKLSGGMKQKLALCCALIHRPKVLLLDEPTTGVDPVSRSEFWEMLKRLQKQGITILVSTAYMDEAKLCDRIALMQAGRFLQVDTPANIVSTYPDTLWAVRADRMRSLLADLRAYPGVKSAYAFGGSCHVTLNGGDVTDGLTAYLLRQGYADIVAAPAAPSVEDCFMWLLDKEESR